jgi:hypothetical protein
MLVETFDFEAERGSEVFFVADHHIYERRQFAINRDRLCLTTNRLPERVAIIQIVGDDRAVLSFAASIASRATAGVVSDNAQKMPPV